MELLSWMVIPGFLLILLYGFHVVLSYHARKEEIEQDIDRLNYLDAWLSNCYDNHPTWIDYTAERNVIRARLIRRGIEV